MTTSSASPEPFLADQIEVLKGPATLLYGSGAIGGIVNIVDGRIAERPLDQAVSGRAEARADSVNDGFAGMARVDTSGADGALVLHADGVHRNQKDYDTPDGSQPKTALSTPTPMRSAHRWWVMWASSGFRSRATRTLGNPGEPGDIANGERGVSLDLLQNRFELKGGVN